MMSGGNRKRLRSSRKSRSNFERIEQLKKTDIGAKVLQNLDEEEREEQAQIEEQKKKVYDLQMGRLKREAKKRERLRKIEEYKEKHAMERIEQLKTDFEAKLLQNLDDGDFATLDEEDIMVKVWEQLKKEKKELTHRLNNQEKEIDHFARAKRLEEIPLLTKQYEQEKKVFREFFEQQEAEKIEQLNRDRQMALASQDRLNRMKTDKDEFLNLFRGQRKEVFEKKLAEFEAKVSEERKKRLYERKEKRREERRQKWIQERAKEEKRRKDEQFKREREERKARKKLEAEKRKKKSRLAKLEKQAEKQRQRKREAEEKKAKRRQELENTSGRDDGKEDRPKPIAGRPGERPSWRDREQEKEEEGGRDGRAWRPAGAREGGGWREREKQRSSIRLHDENDGPKEEGWGGERCAHGEDKPQTRGNSPHRDTWRSRGEDRVPSRDGGERGGFGERRRDDRDFGRGRDDRDFGRGRDDRDRDFGRLDDRDFGRRDDRDRDFGRRDDRDFEDRERKKEKEGGFNGRTWRPAGAREGGGWREREKQRSESWKKERSPTKRYEEKAGGERGVLLGKTGPQLEVSLPLGTRGEAEGRIEYHQGMVVNVGDLENAEEMVEILEEDKKGNKRALPSGVPVQSRKGNQRKNREQRKTFKKQEKEVEIN